MSNTVNQNTQILGLKYPLLGLSPMDGITDNAFRQIVKKYGNPDLLFTEFSNVMGICYAAENVLNRFDYTEMQRPVVGQIFGAEPEWFYHASKIIVALGFDGVDINMGCPANSVSGRGAGAGLIRTPELAKEIIREVQRGVRDFVETGKLTGLKAKQEKFVWMTVERMKNRLTREDIEKVFDSQLSVISNEEINYNNFPLGILNLVDSRHKNLLENVQTANRKLITENRFLVPVSVKTRIGYDVPITQEWIQTVASENPAWISVHGRTLKQMYNGKADRNELKKAVEATDIPVIVNGDIGSREEALEVIEQTGAFGALIGRAVFGNPFVFSPHQPLSIENGEGGRSEARPGEVLAIMLEHAKLFNDLHENNEKAFVQMRKHFGWYTKEIFNSQFSIFNEEEFRKTFGFDSPKELRMRLMQVRSYDELKEIFK